MRIKGVLKGIWTILLISIIIVGFGSCSSHRHSVKKRSTYVEKRHKKHDTGKEQKQARNELNEIKRELKGDAKILLEEAFEWLGTRYEYGRQEKGKSTDCSGFVMVVFETAIGCKLPRNSAKQAEFCDKVKERDVHAGDLVFFITNGGSRINHVGIMIDEVQFIHASSKGVALGSLEKDFYRRTFQRFGRVPCMKH